MVPPSAAKLSTSPIWWCGTLTEMDVFAGVAGKSCNYKNDWSIGSGCMWIIKWSLLLCLLITARFTYWAIPWIAVSEYDWCNLDGWWCWPNDSHIRIISRLMRWPDAKYVLILITKSKRTHVVKILSISLQISHQIFGPGVQICNHNLDNVAQWFSKLGWSGNTKMINCNTVVIWKSLGTPYRYPGKIVFIIAMDPCCHNGIKKQHIRRICKNQ